MNSVTFPWPPRECSPNWRGHWATKAKAVKAYRKTCWVLALKANINLDWCAEIYLHTMFYPPSKRRFDQDNCIAAIKGGLDGLADALDVNDRLFRILPSMGCSRPSGAIHIQIAPTP